MHNGSKIRVPDLYPREQNRELGRPSPDRPDTSAPDTLERPPASDMEQELVCPITRAVFVDPVVAGDGHTYERAAIQRVLREWQGDGFPPSPMTNIPLPHDNLMDNWTLKSICARWRAEREGDGKDRLRAEALRLRVYEATGPDLLSALKDLRDFALHTDICVGRLQNLKVQGEAAQILLDLATIEQKKEDRKHEAHQRILQDLAHKERAFAEAQAERERVGAEFEAAQDRVKQLASLLVQVCDQESAARRAFQAAQKLLPGGTKRKR